MYYVNVTGNIKIAVEDICPKKSQHTVVFIHGWPLNNKIFEYQYNVFYKNNIRCIGIDLRGFGKSDITTDGYCYEQLAQDVYEVVMKLRLDNIVLAGFSMGGAIAVKYASMYKNFKLKKLALLAAAAPCFTQREDYPYGLTKEQVNDLIKKTYQDRPQMVYDFEKNLFASNPSEELRAWYRQIGLSASGIGTIKAAESLRDEDLRSDLKNIKVPTGIFHGILDEVCPYEFAIQLNQGIKNSEVYTFAKSGHAIFYDELQLFNIALTEFIVS